MDSSAAQKVEEPFYRLRVLMEPRGFLRAIEFVLTVVMFATTAGFSSSYQYTIICKSDNYVYDKLYDFGYPFDLQPFQALCDDIATRTPDANSHGAAAFFVAIGVMAMLYCIVSLLWYVFLEVKFLRFDLVPICDFVTTVVFAVFFFLASCIWASGVNKVKYWTNFDNVVKKLFSDFCGEGLNTCVTGPVANYGSLNVAIVFGFLNCFVWGANGWFTFKETTWFQKRQAKTSQPHEEGEKVQPPNDV